MSKSESTTKVFTRRAAISLPMFDLSANKDGSAKSHFIKISSPFVKHESEKENASQDIMKATVTELHTGEQSTLYIHKGLAVKFTENENYEVIVTKPKGRRFAEHTIYSLDIE